MFTNHSEYAGHHTLASPRGRKAQGQSGRPVLQDGPPHQGVFRHYNPHIMNHYTIPNTRKALQLAKQTTELSFAAPQVVALRVARMATAGADPSDEDRREFTLMGAEKLAAFTESWHAMGMQMLQAQQHLWSGWWGYCANPLKWAQPWEGMGLAAVGSQYQQAWLDVMRKGLKPVHSRAVANARRLGHREAARASALR